MSYGDGQFDVSAKDRRLIEDRAKLRAELRKEFVKQVTNPHRQSGSEGGYLFDSAMQRWMSMRAQQYPFFKRNPKTLLYPLIVLSTCFGYGHWIKRRREKREITYRTGQVAYKDRSFKFV